MVILPLRSPHWYIVKSFEAYIEFFLEGRLGFDSLSPKSQSNAQGEGAAGAGVTSLTEVASELSSRLSGQVAREGAGQPAGQPGDSSGHTLAGDVVGWVRDLGIFGGPPKTASERASRAKSDDQIAQIAADTVAALPGVKTWVGGLVRATMLIDPGRSLTGNAGAFALNFAEGAAFNKVSKLMLPGSSLSEFTAARLGSGFASEAVTNATVGFGFGAIRTGFDRNTWVDQNGNVDLAKGAESLLKGSAVGALVNVPAGFIGMRVGRASSLMLGESGLSPRLGQALAGAGSGYAAGGVFGGVDAIMQHKSFADTLRSINEGGLIGAASGGLMGAFPGYKVNFGEPSQLQSASAGAGTKSLAGESSGLAGASEMAAGSLALTGRSPGPGFSESIKAPEISGNTSQPSTDQPAFSESLSLAGQRIDEPFTSVRHAEAALEPTSKEPWQIADVSADQWDKITYFPEAAKFSELTGRLSEPVSEVERYNYIPENVKGPFKSVEEFLGQARQAERDVRVYSVKGLSTKIVVPEEYAQQLDQVRELRLKASQPNALLDALSPKALREVQAKVAESADTMPAAQTAAGQDAFDIIKAQLSLKSHPYALAALPEDFIPLLDALPNPASIKQLSIVNESNYQDPWHRQTYKPDFEAAATADSETGRVTFFKALRDDVTQSQQKGRLGELLYHEDGHLVKDPQGYYALAARLEENGYFVTDYSRRDFEENRAEHRALGLLSPETDNFLELAKEAPIRTSVMAQQLAQTLKESPDGVSSAHRQQYLNRIQFVRRFVLPEAQAQLTAGLHNSDNSVREASAKLLGYLGNSSHIPELVNAAVNLKDAQVNKAAFDAALQINEKSPRAQVETLWQLGAPHSHVRDQAIETMRSLQFADPGAIQYGNILGLMASPDNLPKVAEQISAIPSAQGKSMAFQQAMQMGDWPGYRKNLALIVLKDNPTLRAQALEALKSQTPDNIKPLVQRYTTDSDPSVRKLADQLMHNVDEQSLIASARAELDRGHSLDYKTINALGRLGVREAIPVLIQAAALGNGTTGEAAFNNLSNYQPTMVKYYARSLKTDLPMQAQPVLESIMNGRGFPQSHAG